MLRALFASDDCLSKDFCPTVLARRCLRPKRGNGEGKAASLKLQTRNATNEATDRGRNGALVCAAPPSEPDWRISRIRLSSHEFASSALSASAGQRHTWAPSKSDDSLGRYRFPLHRVLFRPPRGIHTALVLARWAIDLRCRTRLLFRSDLASCRPSLHGSYPTSSLLWRL